MESNQSEVARIKAQIAAEQESAQRAMCSSAYGTCQHRFITARYNRIGESQDRLEELVGEEKAAKLIVEALECSKPSNASVS